MRCGVTEGRLRLSASDVANFVACQHLTRLDLLEARGAAPAAEFDLGFQDLVRRGEAHERTVLERFRADGRASRRSAAPGRGAGDAAAIRGGADVIYQGVLRAPGAGRRCWGGRTSWCGRPAPGAGRGAAAGGRHYEVVDAKLARTAKAPRGAQTAFYSQLLAELQGDRPRWMHLALGNGEFVPFKVGDFAAYERQTRRRLVEFIAADAGTTRRRSLPRAGGALRDLPVERAVRRTAAARRRPVARRRDDDGPAAGAEGRGGRDPARLCGPGRLPGCNG